MVHQQLQNIIKIVKSTQENQLQECIKTQVTMHATLRRTDFKTIYHKLWHNRLKLQVLFFFKLVQKTGVALGCLQQILFGEKMKIQNCSTEDINFTAYCTQLPRQGMMGNSLPTSQKQDIKSALCSQLNNDCFMFFWSLLKLHALLFKELFGAQTIETETL